MRYLIFFVFLSIGISSYPQAITSDSSVIFIETKETLNEQLDQFEGEIVYIDLWGTFCKGCISLFKYKNRVTPFFTEKDIVTLYICMDTNSNKDKWKSLVLKHQLKGYHVFVELDSRESYKTGFDLPEKHLKRLGQGFPRFMIIGRNGEVLEKYAEAPSQTLINDIKKFLE